MICLCGWKKKISLAILMLKDKLSTILIGKNPKYGIVRFMFHNNNFILNMIKFESGCVIKIDQEYFSKEKLNNLSISLIREYLLFRLLILNLDQVNFIFIILKGSPVLSNFNFLYIVLTLNLTNLLSSRN